MGRKVQYFLLGNFMITNPKKISTLISARFFGLIASLDSQVASLLLEESNGKSIFSKNQYSALNIVVSINYTGAESLPPAVYITRFPNKIFETQINIAPIISNSTIGSTVGFANTFSCTFPYFILTNDSPNIYPTLSINNRAATQMSNINIAIFIQ